MIGKNLLRIPKSFHTIVHIYIRHKVSSRIYFLMITSISPIHDACIWVGENFYEVIV